MARVETVSYDTWEQLKSELFKQLYQEPRFRPDEYLFRGQARGDWSLVPSFDRWYRTWGRGRDRVALSEEFVATFLSACEDQGHDIGVGPGDLAAVALAQHYGVPTRLLDWSESPYVAAFFAFQNYLQLEADPFETVAIWALNRRAECWTPASGIEVLRTPRVANIRLRNQYGLFTLSKSTAAGLEEAVRAASWDGVALWRILLPSNNAAVALSDLAAMGLSPARLFPELEGAAAAARQRLILPTL